MRDHKAFFLTFVALCGIILVGTSVRAEIKTERISYRDGATELRGFLAYDDSRTNASPGLLLIHEWWGLNSYVESRAVQYAKLGYVVFAPDMYGKGAVTTDPKQAGVLSGSFYADRALFRRRAAAGLAVLSGNPKVDPKREAVMGYCFGGSAALELARSGADLKATVVFHGGLSNPNPADAKNITGAVLVMLGADDTFISPTERDAFKNEMDAAKKPYQYVNYLGAQHAFTNPNADSLGIPGVRYNRDADVDSFSRSKELLATVFK